MFSGRKYLPMMRPTRVYFPKYKNRSYRSESKKKKKKKNLKSGQKPKQILLQKSHTDECIHSQTYRHIKKTYSTWKNVQYHYCIIANQHDHEVSPHSCLNCCCFSEANLGPILCDPMNCSMPGWPSSKSVQTINTGEGVEKKELSYIVGGNV